MQEFPARSQMDVQPPEEAELVVWEQEVGRDEGAMMSLISSSILRLKASDSLVAGENDELGFVAR